MTTTPRQDDGIARAAAELWRVLRADGTIAGHVRRVRDGDDDLWVTLRYRAGAGFVEMGRFRDRAVAMDVARAG
jgi:hypothetical protein